MYRRYDNEGVRCDSYIFERIDMRESDYQAKLKKKVQALLPGAIVLVMPGNILQGFPDILILNENGWAALEVKVSWSAKRQPNQDYYVDLLGEMSFADYIYPENEEVVLDALQQALGS